MYDPETVQQAVAAGVGATIEAAIGGKVDNLHGAPVQATAYVEAITDGVFTNDGPLGTGSEAKLGLTVVLEIGGRGGIEVITTSFRSPNDARRAALRRHRADQAPDRCHQIVRPLPRRLHATGARDRGSRRPRPGQPELEPLQFSAAGTADLPAGSRDGVGGGE